MAYTPEQLERMRKHFDLDNVDIRELTHIDLKNTGLTEIPKFSDPGLIQTLDLCDNVIKEVEDMRLPNLWKLYLDKNRIRKIKGLVCPKLDRLFLNNNEISSVDEWGELENLEVLTLTGNKVTNLEELGLEQLPKLRMLDICTNPVTDLTYLTNLKTLKVLDLTGEQLYKAGKKTVGHSYTGIEILKMSGIKVRYNTY
jgi:Leucine-rich repeat (LRR) protein